MQVGEGRSPLEWAQHQDLGGAGAEEDVGQSGKGRRSQNSFVQARKKQEKARKGIACYK